MDEFLQAIDLDKLGFLGAATLLTELVFLFVIWRIHRSAMEIAQQAIDSAAKITERLLDLRRDHTG